jgi:hypothetical protein
MTVSMPTQPVDERHDEGEPGFQGALVAAEPLHHPRGGLGDDPHRAGQDGEDHDRDGDGDDESGHRDSVS